MTVNLSFGTLNMCSSRLCLCVARARLLTTISIYSNSTYIVLSSVHFVQSNSIMLIFIYLID